jgi:branched-chain amino acid transport system substrate-binding protein
VTAPSGARGELRRNSTSPGGDQHEPQEDCITCGARRSAIADGRAGARAGHAVKLGVLNDRSGIYADLVRRRLGDRRPHGRRGFRRREGHQGRDRLGRPPEQARRRLDHRPRNGTTRKASTPSSTCRPRRWRWPSEITRDMNKIFINSGAATSDLTGSACSPNTVHWTYDTWQLLPTAPAARWSPMAATAGSSSPPTTPSAMRSSATPRPSIDQWAARWWAAVRTRSRARTSRPSCCRPRPPAPRSIGLANAGGDTINSIKQASEFGITQGGQSLAGLLVFINDVHALGLRCGAGPCADRELLLGPERPDPRMVGPLRRSSMGKKPTMVQAGVYAGLLHYLKAVEAPAPRKPKPSSPR